MTFLTGIQSLSVLQSLSSLQGLSGSQSLKVLNGLQTALTELTTVGLAGANASKALVFLTSLSSTTFSAFIAADDLTYLNSGAGATLIESLYTLLTTANSLSGISYLKDLNDQLVTTALSSGSAVNLNASLYTPVVSQVGCGEELLAATEATSKMLGEFSGLHDIFTHGGLSVDGATTLNTLVPQMAAANILTEPTLTGAAGVASSTAMLKTLTTFAR